MSQPTVLAAQPQQPDVVERTPAFQDWIKWKAGANSVVDAQEKMMSQFVSGPMVARTVTKKFTVKFTGSLRKFQQAAEIGIPVSVKLGQILSYRNFLPRERRPNKNMSPKDQMLCAQLTPDKYDLTKAIVHDVSIVKFDNQPKAHLGLHCDAVPKAYMNMGNDEIKRLLKFFTDNEGDVWCNKHIPAATSGEFRIPVIREVANGYNSRHIAATFGGIYNTAQLNNGTMILMPQLCKEIGLDPPKRRYIAPENVNTSQLSDEELAQYKINTWVLVTAGHAHTWVCSLPPQAISQLGYEIYPVRVDGEQVPFYLMDYVTVDKLTYFVGNELIPNIDRRDIRDVAITLQPFVSTQVGKQGGTQNWTGPSWMDYDMNPDEEFTVTLDLLISYTLFPIGMERNSTVACIMTENFPPMRLDGALPLLSQSNGNEEDEKRTKQ